MAKTIKFNLICDDKPVRTIEDLQKNFSIEDILEYYNNKLLHRWLEVRGYNEELEKVKAISSDKPLDIINQLIIVFNISTNNEKKIKEAVYMLEYLEERKFLYEDYKKNGFKRKQVIDDYQSGYQQLVNGILDNPEDVAQIKANIVEIVKNYEWALDMNHRELFWTLFNKSSLAIMCLLMNEQSRKYYIPIESITEDGEIIKDIDENRDKERMFSEISQMIKWTEFSTQLGENLISFSGITDGYWKDLEPKGKKFMIISMGTGDFVRSAGVSGGDLSHEEVTDKFVIVDGIDYKSNSSTRKLLYMEV